MITGNTTYLTRFAVPVFCVFLIWGFGTGALWMTRPLFAASFGVSLFFVGLISALSAAPRIVSGPITGFLVDRLGRRPLIFSGAAAHGLILVGQSFSISYLQYAILEVFAGLAIALWTVSSSVLVADVTGLQNRGRGVALRNTAQRLGMLAGPVVGGLIATIFELRYVFIFIASTKVVVIFITLLFIPETRPDRLPQTFASEKTQPLGRNLAMFRNQPFAGLAAATMVFGMIGLGPGVFRTYLPIHAQDAAGLSPAMIGNLVGLAGLITLALAIPTGMVLDRYGRKKPIAVGLVVIAIATSLLGMAAGFPSILLAVAAFALAEGMNSNTIQTYAMDLAPRDHRGMFLGVYHLMTTSGMVIGPLGAGLVAGFFSLQIALFVFSGVASAGALLFIILSRETLVRSEQARGA